MTMPKGWGVPREKEDEFPSIVRHSLKVARPPASQLAHPMVDSLNLPVNEYEIYGIEVFETNSGMQRVLLGTVEDKELKAIQVQPPEGSSSLIFYDGKTSGQFPSVFFSQIVEVRIIDFLEIIFIGRENIQFLLKVDMNFSDRRRIIKEIQTIMEKDSDSSYWTGYSLSFPNTHGEEKCVNIYPLTPFLADGEEIVWLTKWSILNDKVISIDALTNFRILHYSYEKHTGITILISNLKDVAITNQKNATLPKERVGYTEFGKKLANSIKSKTVGTIGDITFMSSNGISIMFKQINAPENMADIVLELKNKYGPIQVGEPIEIEPETFIQDQQINTTDNISPQDESKVMSINCSQCSRNNPIGSKFCNGCGSPLSPVCNKCGNSNPSGAMFCGKCGSRLNGSANFTSAVTRPARVEGEVIESNFLEYVMPEYRLRLRYPANWRKVESGLTDPFTKVIFASPQESPSDPWIEALALGMRDIPLHISLKDWLELEIADVSKNSGFQLIDSHPITVSGIEAHQFVWIDEGKKSLGVIAIRAGKGLFLLYKAETQKYMKFLSTVEQIISSLEFY